MANATPHLLLHFLETISHRLLIFGPIILATRTKVQPSRRQLDFQETLCDSPIVSIRGEENRFDYRAVHVKPGRCSPHLLHHRLQRLIFIFHPNS